MLAGDDDDDADVTTRAGWARAFTERALAHWTPARTAALAGGKRLRIPPAAAPLLLRALGLLHRDASMPPDRVRKYFQVAHMLGLLEAPLRELQRRLGRPVQVLDAGCGRSYITMVLAWAGAQPGGVPVRVLGVDRRPDVIAASARRCTAAGLDELARWIVADVDAPALAAEPIDAVIALHACDRASCDAIALGCSRQAALIAVAPCCQAELARGWADLGARGAPGGLRPVWTAPHLRRELGAHVTDAMRLVLLRARGYHARAIELVPDEHTRKNTLLIAEQPAGIDASSSAEAWREHDALVASTGGVELALAARLR